MMINKDKYIHEILANTIGIVAYRIVVLFCFDFFFLQVFIDQINANQLKLRIRVKRVSD